MKIIKKKSFKNDFSNLNHPFFIYPKLHNTRWFGVDSSWSAVHLNVVWKFKTICNVTDIPYICPLKRVLTFNTKIKSKENRK